ncbi:MAG: hypothetical protein Q4G43_17385 [Mobilicoccus sp.]|nr:hypothetical protein [Mobilicoccus sp.]
MTDDTTRDRSSDYAAHDALADIAAARATTRESVVAATVPTWHAVALGLAMGILTWSYPLDLPVFAPIAIVLMLVMIVLIVDSYRRMTRAGVQVSAFSEMNRHPVLFSATILLALAGSAFYIVGDIAGWPTWPLIPIGIAQVVGLPVLGILTSRAVLRDAKGREQS